MAGPVNAESPDDPAAFTVDAHGDVYVAETYRLHDGVTDMRNHMGWLEDDLASTDARIYEGLDVVVLESRGDHIQDLLSFLKLNHRITRSGTLLEDAVHPSGVFVANCSGAGT